MGFKDHKKVWLFEVHATPAQCEQVFREVFETGRANAILGIKNRMNFVVQGMSDNEVGQHLVASFQGHAGFDRLFQGVVGIVSQTVRSMNRNAIGSQVAFRARPTDEPGLTRCELWLKNWVEGLSTHFKRFMKEVERELRKLDDEMRIAKIRRS